MASKQNAVELVNALTRAGVNFVASLPDASLAPMIEVIDETNSILHVPLSREEEGVGVCAGAHVGGKRSCC
jgi:sulfopyruvate decarboxylase subunit alpha